MSGESTTRKGSREECRLLEYFEALLEKLLEETQEAYYRTPLHISSKPYAERAYRLAQAGYEAVVEEIRSRCR